MIRNWKETSIVGTDCDLPILDTVDVLVVGGGAAGVAAATVAAEAGASVVLVEEYGFCGGAAVAGMSGTVCGMYAASDTPGSPVQIVQGFSERFSVELTKRGGLTAPQMYGKTWTAAHDPLVWREAAETMLLDVGVRILFHITVIGVIMEGASYEGVVVESTAGRSLIRARGAQSTPPVTVRSSPVPGTDIPTGTMGGFRIRRCSSGSPVSTSTGFSTSTATT